MTFAATRMDLKIVILSEVNQTEKEKYRIASLICEIQKEMIKMNLVAKQKENELMVAGGKIQGSDIQGV